MRLHWIPLMFSLLLLACDDVSQPTTSFAQFTSFKVPKSPISTSLGDSLLLFNNHGQIVPFRNLLGQHFSIYHFGTPYSTFESIFSKYADFNCYRNPKLHQLVKPISNNISQDSTAVIAIDETMTGSAIFESFTWVINRMSQQKRVVIVNFGHPAQLNLFDPKVIILQVSERNVGLESKAAQALFGGVTIYETAAHYFSENILIQEIPPVRLGFDTPSSVGLDGAILASIDTIAQLGIAQKAYPGCQILVAKNGKIVYNKTFGHHTYQKKQEVQTSDLYDLASITKAAATTLATMKLTETKQLNPNAAIRQYVSGRSALHYIKLKELLTHTSGLQPNIPIAKYIYYAKENGAKCDSLFCTTSSYPYTIKVAEDLYFNELELEKIWTQVFQLRPRRRRRYRYSDVNFMILHKLIEIQAKQQLDDYLGEQFYTPLGLRTATYTPLESKQSSIIIPTILDTTWRHQLLRGDVHDEGAAFLGGVGGNAGLFSNAEDLAVIFQMLLNGGTYGGTTFLAPETIERFTAKQYKVHRGLGFDKPREKRRSSTHAKDASATTFGHTGFTGTCVWADPQHNLIFILLTNRVHPNKYNRQLNRLDIRLKMHQVVYDALIE